MNIQTRVKGIFTKKSTKTNQKLGIDVVNVFNKFMQSEKSGFADKTEFNYFWLAMKDEAPDIDVYIHLLVEYLLAFMSRTNKKLPFNAQVLLNTINFLALRHPISMPSKDVRDILQKWHRNRIKYDDNALPAARDVLGILYKQRVDGGDGLDSLIIQCYQFYSADELSRIADYYQNPTIIHIVDGEQNIGMSSGDKVCIWSYLKKISISNPARFSLVITQTIAKLRSIGGQILLSPKLAEISLLALIFMMRQLISYSRVPDEKFLTKCISNLKRFYLWPVPYGTQARDLLIKLQKERIAPGYALLQKVWRECRLPEIELSIDALPQRKRTHANSNARHLQNNNNNNSNSNQNPILDAEEESHSFRPLFYLFDIHDSTAILVANIMKIDAQSDWGTDYAVHSGPSPYTCAILILNIISHDCGHSLPLVNAIKTLKANEIVQFYKECIDIFVSSSANNSTIAKQARNEGLLELRKQIIAYANEKEAEDELLDDEVLLEDELHFEMLEQLPMDGEYTVELPVLHHTGIGSDLTKMEFPNSGQMASNEIIYPSNDVLLKMTTLLKTLLSMATNEDPITLRFMIAGGNSILTGVITAFATLLRHAQNLLQAFNLEFFVLPYSKNYYAEWLARQDPWYNRHIYLPLQCELFVAPALLPDTRAKLTDTGYLHTVGQFYRELSETYAREADQLVPLRIWEVLCWEQPPYTKTPHKLIPFCQRIEFGKTAEYRGQLQMYELDGGGGGGGANTGEMMNVFNTFINTGNDDSKSNTDSGNMTRESMDNNNSSHNHNNNSTVEPSNSNEQPPNTPGTANINDINTDNHHNLNMNSAQFIEGLRSFDYQPVVIDVDWTPVDMLGRKQLTQISQKHQICEKLFVASVPRYKDKGFPASPDKSSVIHMFVELHSSAFARKKKFQEFGLFKTEPSQNIRACTITSIKSADVFSILIDDRIYGKFSKIKIQPMIDPISKQQAYLPVRTFFPIQGS